MTHLFCAGHNLIINPLGRFVGDEMRQLHRKVEKSTCDHVIWTVIWIQNPNFCTDLTFCDFKRPSNIWTPPCLCHSYICPPYSHITFQLQDTAVITLQYQTIPPPLITSFGALSSFQRTRKRLRRRKRAFLVSDVSCRETAPLRKCEQDTICTEIKCLTQSELCTDFWVFRSAFTNAFNCSCYFCSAIQSRMKGKMVNVMYWASSAARSLFKIAGRSFFLDLMRSFFLRRFPIYFIFQETLLVSRDELRGPPVPNQHVQKLWVSATLVAQAVVDSKLRFQYIVCTCAATAHRFCRFRCVFDFTDLVA